VSIRALTAAEGERIVEVARRMRATLVEVLGAERGSALYPMRWLRARARAHVKGEGGAVFVAERAGALVGHTIVRDERDHGLFSTTYVPPRHRRRAVASRLLDRGEAWMRARGLSSTATCTDARNAPLIRLFERRGYRIVHREAGMVRLAGEFGWPAPGETAAE